MTKGEERTDSYGLGFADLEEEVEVARLSVEGEIPGWLSGDLIRNGPAKWKVGEGRLRHWFDGLAMLQKLPGRRTTSRPDSTASTSAATRSGRPAERPRTWGYLVAARPRA